jgi:hypothetical protein
MDTRREIKLPVPANVARQRLTAAFASTVVVQKGTGLLSRITCTGSFLHETLTVHYVDQGRSILRYTVKGHLVDDMAGSRLIVTISDGSYFIPYYVPVVLWISYSTLRNCVPGQNFTSSSLVSLLAGGMATGMLSIFLKLIPSLYLSISANKIEFTLVKISMGTL